jgi:hypothetical protein
VRSRPAPRHDHIQQAPLLVVALTGKEDVVPVEDVEGGQQRVAVLPPRRPGLGRGQIEGSAVNHLHIEPFTQPGGLVHPVAARAEVPIDLLQSDEVATRGGERTERTIEVEHAVLAHTVMDVEGRHPHEESVAVASCGTTNRVPLRRGTTERGHQ